MTGIWAKLQQTKAIVCEPRGTGDAFDAVMADFYSAIRAGRGAIFFAICRGKVQPFACAHFLDSFPFTVVQQLLLIDWLSCLCPSLPASCQGSLCQSPIRMFRFSPSTETQIYLKGK